VARKKFKLRSEKKVPPRAKRQKQSEKGARPLVEDASVGTYLIDDVARELFSFAATGPLSKTEFIKLMRHKIDFAAQFAAMAAKNQFVRQPKRRRLTRRFFDDLGVIRSRIDRNRNLELTDLLLSIFPTGRSPRDAPRRLQAALQHTSELIRDFLQSNKRDPGGGNHDYFTRTFIDEIFEYWCEFYVAAASKDEFGRFIKLLSAAWRDVDFRRDDEDGRDLEQWLAERVRKQFVDGISETRVSRQEFQYSLPPDPGLPEPANLD
jgi:hypothetical protein